MLFYFRATLLFLSRAPSIAGCKLPYPPFLTVSPSPASCLREYAPPYPQPGTLRHQPWGFGWSSRQLSFASLIVIALASEGRPPRDTSSILWCPLQKFSVKIPKSPWSRLCPGTSKVPQQIPISSASSVYHVHIGDIQIAYYACSTPPDRAWFDQTRYLRKV